MALEPKTVNAKAKTQAMGMELRQLVLRVDPPKPKGFFRLPVELRTHIYRYCLLELPRWEKRHGAACQHAPRDYMSLERPPFTFSTDTSMGPVKNGRLGLVLASCDCAKRKGLSLLRLNRQIHREAAAIFWTGNVFCWQRPVTFVKNISAGVRDEYRRLIRHISIVSDAWENDCRFPRIVWDTVRPYDRFWAAVHKCTGLHSLELRPEYVTWYHEPVCTLRRHCPQLESFRLVKLHLYDLIYEDDGGGAYLCPPEKRRLLWFKTAWPVDLGRITDRESCRETTRDFYTNFLVHARFAIETHLLGRPANQFGLNVCAAYPYRVPGLDDTSGSQSIQLRDGSKCDIHVFGLPLSKATRLRHAKERMFADLMLKRQGKLTPREEKLKGKIVEIRQDKRALRREKAYEKRDKEIDSRQKRQADDRRTQQEEAERETLAKQEAFQRDVREAKELRLMERKRSATKPKLRPTSGAELSI